MEFEELAQPFKELEDYETKANNEEIVNWFRKVRAACLNAASSRAIILELQEILGKKDTDLHDEKSPYYSFLLACVHDFLGNIDDAIINIKSSALGFTKLGKDKDWQQSISCWLHGLFLCKQGQFDSAKEKIKIAIDIFSKLDKKQDHFGEYRDEYKNMIETIQLSYSEAYEKQIKEQKPYVPKKDGDSPLPQSESRYNAKASQKQSPPRELASSERKQKTQQKPRKKPQPRPQKKKRTRISQRDTQDGHYIVIPWLPIYRSVSAGPSGIVVMDSPTKVYVTLNTIEIFDIPYKLHSIKKNSMTDRQISLTHGFAYGLVKVEGESMSAAHPIAINNGDYVLFTKQPNAEDNDIVIASRALSSGDLAYMVKRYKKKEVSFVSEYKDATTYPPIKINQDHQILGVVIAIAKTVEETN